MKNRREYDGDDIVGAVLLKSKKARSGSGSSSSSSSSSPSSSSSEDLQERASKFIQTVRTRLKGQGDLYSKFLRVLKSFKVREFPDDVSPIVLDVKDLFQCYDGNVDGGITLFLPEGFEMLDVEMTETEDENGEALHQVKLWFRILNGGADDHVFNAFVDGMDPNWERTITDRYNRIVRLLGDHPDLLQEFDRLMGFHDATPPPPPPPARNPEEEIKAILVNQGLQLCEKVEQVLCVSEYMDFLKLLHDYSYGSISRDDLEAAVASILGFDRNLVEDFKSFIKVPEEHLSRFRKFEKEKQDFKSFIKVPEEHLSRFRKFEKEKKEKKQIKSVRDLDLSKCERISRSYYLLPEAYRGSSGGGRGLENDEVLNDDYISVRDYPSKHKQIGEDEKIRFKLEDDRCEIEILMGMITSSIENMKKLWDAIEEKRINLETGISVEDHLSILNRRCIERLYGDYGLEVLEILKEKPYEALPMILKRLEQKHTELKMYQVEFNELCAHIYPKICQKKPKGKPEQKLSRGNAGG